MSWFRNWRSWWSRGKPVSQPQPQPQPSPADGKSEEDRWKDRRQSVRYGINLETSCRLLAMVQGEPHPIRVRNISAGGISLVVPHEVPADELLEVELLNRPEMFLCKLQVRITYRFQVAFGPGQEVRTVMVNVPE